MAKASRTSFEPMNPWLSDELEYTRRNLPHLTVPGATYFVTFRCRSDLELNAKSRDLVMNTLLFWDGRTVDVDAAVVMPNHVHMILRVLKGKLGYVLKSIKSYAARRIVHPAGGGVWMDENFDHILRSEEEWVEKFEYIKDNPVKAGLCSPSENYRWLYIYAGDVS